jgi:hypothetical protein
MVTPAKMGTFFFPVPQSPNRKLGPCHHIGRLPHRWLEGRAERNGAIPTAADRCLASRRQRLRRRSRRVKFFCFVKQKSEGREWYRAIFSSKERFLGLLFSCRYLSSVLQITYKFMHFSSCLAAYIPMVGLVTHCKLLLSPPRR